MEFSSRVRFYGSSFPVLDTAVTSCAEQDDQRRYSISVGSHIGPLVKRKAYQFNGTSKRVKTLSGQGKGRRCSDKFIASEIARGLMLNPGLPLLDEQTLGLDTRLSGDILSRTFIAWRESKISLMHFALTVFLGAAIYAYDPARGIMSHKGTPGG